MIIPMKLTKGKVCSTIKFIFANLIFNYKRRRSNQNHSVVIFVDFISTNLSLAAIYQKNPLTPSIMYIIFNNSSIYTHFSTKSEIRFYIISNLIFFYMSRGFLLNQNPLLKVLKDIIADNDGMRLVIYLYSSHFIKTN